jgi:sugar/nucleoside kinase (ribokinase family)
MTAPTVLVVGDVIDDIVVSPVEAVTRDSDTTSRIVRTPGGSAANQAAWMARAGLQVRLVARVGAADIARHHGELSACGVTPLLIGDPHAPTGTIVVLLDDGGGRTMYTDRGANLRLCAADLPTSLLDGIDVLHVNGYALFADGPRSAVVALISQARGRGIRLTVDPCSAAYLDQLGASVFLECTRDAAVCLPNLDEGRVLTGLSQPADVLAALLRYYEVVALKLGSGGVLVASGGRCELLASAATSVIDPTGAGDAFCAGFIAAWLDGRSPPESALSGTALAARGRCFMWPPCSYRCQFVNSVVAPESGVCGSVVTLIEHALPDWGSAVMRTAVTV